MAQLMATIYEPRLHGIPRIEVNGGDAVAAHAPILGGLDHIEKQVASAFEAVQELGAKLVPVTVGKAGQPVNEAVGSSGAQPQSSALRERLESVSRGLYALRSAISELSSRVDL